jgi:putative membrane protein
MAELRPYELAVWVLEAAPVALALPILWRTHRRFPLTDLLYFSILAYILALVLGGAHLALDRAPYDGLARFLQGFVPALAAREALIRGQLLRAPGTLALAVVCVVLAFGAVVELLEWGAALALGHREPLETQMRLLVSLAGAACALVFFSRLHDRRLKRLDRVSRELTVEPRSAH